MSNKHLPLSEQRARARSYSSAYRSKYPERVKEQRKAYLERNRETEALRKKAYHEANPNKAKARIAKRRAVKLKATPKWLNEKQIAEIQQIYDSCPIGFQVDHIVPLQGKNVCGLHVPWNLQHLTKAENMTKSNHYATSGSP